MCELYGLQYHRKLQGNPVVGHRLPELDWEGE